MLAPTTHGLDQSHAAVTMCGNCCTDRAKLVAHDQPQCGCTSGGASAQQPATHAAQFNSTDCSHSDGHQHAAQCSTCDLHDDSAPLISHGHRSSDAGSEADVEAPLQQGSPRSSAAGSGISEHSCDSCSTDGELFEVVVDGKLRTSSEYNHANCVRMLACAGDNLAMPCRTVAQTSSLGTPYDNPFRCADDVVDPDAKPVWTQLYVEGLCCPAEAPLIHRILQPLDGVHEVRVPIYA